MLGSFEAAGWFAAPCLPAGLKTREPDRTASWGGVAINVQPGARIEQVASHGTIVNRAVKTGGIVSDVSGEIAECVTTMTLASDQGQLGGVAAVVVGTATISDCVLLPRIDSASSVSGGVYGSTFRVQQPTVRRVVSAPAFVRSAGDPVAPVDSGAFRYEAVLFDQDVSGASSIVSSAVGLSTEALRAGPGPDLASFVAGPWRVSAGRYPTPSFFEALIPRRLPCARGERPFGAGTGSDTQPYMVCSPARLNEVRNHLEASFVLARDIDLAGVEMDPITGPFAGRFTGAGHAIRNWSYGAFDRSGLALFLSLSGELRDLRLENIRLRGQRALAGLVLETIEGSAARIANVSVSGRLDAAAGALSGVVGALRGGAHLEDAFFEGTLTSSSGQFHGGVVRGILSGSTARRLEARGAIRLIGSANKAGGIVSDLNGTLEGAVASMRIESASGIRVGGLAAVLGGGAVLKDAYADGVLALQGRPQLVGGLIGEAFGTGSRALERALFVGTATAAEPIAPIIGRNRTGTTFTEVYWDADQLSGASSDRPGVRGQPTAVLQDPDTFSAWPSPPWTFRPATYPSLDFVRGRQP